MNLPPEPDDRALREPFPWMSKTKSPGPYRFTLRSPRSEAAMGLFLVGVTVWIVAVILSDTDGAAVPRLISGCLIVVIFGGMGVLLLVMAVARARWIRAYERVHGHVPPY